LVDRSAGLTYVSLFGPTLRLHDLIVTVFDAMKLQSRIHYSTSTFTNHPSMTHERYSASSDILSNILERWKYLQEKRNTKEWLLASI